MSGNVKATKEHVRDSQWWRGEVEVALLGVVSVIFTSESKVQEVAELESSR